MKWIDINTEKPPQNTWVLVYTNRVRILELIYDEQLERLLWERESTCFESDPITFNKVKFWAPLPAAPKKETNEKETKKKGKKTFWE